jgi:hypothetical protein
MQNDLIISSNYPGGNIKVISQQGNLVKVEQDLRDTTEWWFYWNFCVEDISETEITFEFTNGEVIGPWGPAVSEDGIKWNWLGANGFISHQSFRYHFHGKRKKVYFAFSLPYQVKDFERFYLKYQNHSLLQRETLTISEQGRPIPLLKVGNPNAKSHIVFTCRHHACESTASYLLEGLLSHLLQQKESSLLQNFLIHIIPFVDIDGVEDGDQGKSRAPHDHNRDYIQEPIYKVTSAIMNYVNPLNLVAHIDFHSPYKWGSRDDHPFFVKLLSPHLEEIERLSMLLEETTASNKRQDKVSHQRKFDIEPGEEWNQPGLPTCSVFCGGHGAKLACSFEFPYFGSGDPIFTIDNSRRFGADFARALTIYLDHQSGLK